MKLDMPDLTPSFRSIVGLLSMFGIDKIAKETGVPAEHLHALTAALELEGVRIEFVLADNDRDGDLDLHVSVGQGSAAELEPQAELEELTPAQRRRIERRELRAARRAARKAEGE